MMAQIDVTKAYPPPSTNNSNYTDLITIFIVPVLGGIAVTVVILGVILFKRKLMSSHGLILGVRMFMWLSSHTWEATNASETARYPNISTAERVVCRTLVASHIVVNVLGLGYWSRLGVMEYHRNGEKSNLVVFEIGAWFTMLVLSCVEVYVVKMVGERRYGRVSHWYIVGISFICMAENRWRTDNGRGKVNAEDDRLLESQLIGKMEEAFDEVKRLCMEDSKKLN
ncbi:unnamed protein product [Cuscuta europaea]|uniref:Uncharacterized protein n=1 Tax=Cuscuta europaea TaxID=41803 RepID=A0A9P0Z4E8_CUSEU|nr:unnamed protein product [Cuscuta europaea]